MASSRPIGLLFVVLLFASLRRAATLGRASPPPDPSGAAHELLLQFGLPKGLLPGNVVGYTKSDDGEFTVELSAACYSQFSVLAYYEQRIRGRISYGKISDLSGIQVRRYFVWFSVARVEAGRGGDTVLFDTGAVSETHPASEFEDIRPCTKAAAAVVAADA